MLDALGFLLPVLGLFIIIMFVELDFFIWKNVAKI